MSNCHQNSRNRIQILLIRLNFLYLKYCDFKKNLNQMFPIFSELTLHLEHVMYQCSKVNERQQTET